jgi:hypothetical protein
MKSHKYKNSRKNKSLKRKIKIKTSKRRSFKGKGMSMDKLKSKIKQQTSDIKRSFDKIKHDYNKKETSKDIVKIIEKQQKQIKKLDSLCDDLFCKFGDTEMCVQFKDMKKTKPKYESDNLCKNYAMTLK